MANWALVIGINQYSKLQSLSYAVSDAEAMRDYFWDEAKFQEIFYFSDNSPNFTAPNGSTIETLPTRGNLRLFLRDFFADEKSPPLKPGDNFWFFFSGHGIRHEERDYLMPKDGNPRAIKETAISVNYITERLRRSGADNVILFLDACRNEGAKSGLGIGMEKHQGVVTISSCSPQELSYEIEELGQSSFTYALLEGLRVQGENNCATVERLYQHLCFRVPIINQSYNKPLQTPYAITEPANKLHLILLINQATQADITLLKNHAWRAESNKDFELAKQFWIRVNLAAKGLDADAIAAFKRLKNWPKARSKGQEYSRKEPTLQNFILEEEIELKFRQGIDYTKLQDLLSNQQFKEADLETWHLMCQVTLRRKEQWLDRKSIQKLPYEDLQIINQLWIKYSDGWFGFSIQKEIYEGSGGEWEEFAARVGWYKPLNERKWLNYDELNFETNAPYGHLPAAIFRASEYFGVCGDGTSLAGVSIITLVVLRTSFLLYEKNSSYCLLPYVSWLCLPRFVYIAYLLLLLIAYIKFAADVWSAKIKDISQKTTSALLSRKDL